MNNSIQWPKAGEVLGDFIIDSPREITTMRARYLATHEPSNKKALITCGTCALDSKSFLKKSSELFICQFKGAAKILDAKSAGDFYWIASEYIECEAMPAALRKKLGAQNRPNDLDQKFKLATIFGLGIARTLERFQGAGFVHGELDPFRTALGVRGDRFASLLLETGFNDLIDYDFDRARAHPLFCAPEQLHGHPPCMRADMYACAMIMRVLMLGSPFSKDPDQLLRQCQHERPTPLKQSWPSLGRLSDLMDAALEKDPSNRPRDWDEFLAELGLFLAEIGISTTEERESARSSGPLSSEEAERSSVPAKSKVHAQTLIPAPETLNRERLKRAPKGARAGNPLSIVGRAGKTQTAYFQAPSECGVYQINKVLDGLGTLQRYQALDTQSQKDALLLCMRARSSDDERFNQWIEKRASLQMKCVPELLACGVDEGLYFIGEECAGGLPLEDVLPLLAQTPMPLREVILASMARIVATAMHECAQAGFLHGNLNPHWHLRYEIGAQFKLTIHEIGALNALDAQSVARRNPYAAPEVREGKAWDHRADIYSYAAILFEQITGFAAEPLRDGFEDMSLGHPLGDAVIRALAADPEKRFATWLDFREAMKKAVPSELMRALGVTSDVDEPSSSGEDEPSSPSGSGSSGEATPLPPKPPSHPAISPPLIRSGKPGAHENASKDDSDSERPTARKPGSLAAGDPTPSTLRSEGVQKKSRALVSAPRGSGTLVLWTPSPVVIYERSPMVAFRHTPEVVDERLPMKRYEPVPLALYGVRGKLLKLKAIQDSKHMGAVFAALAVAAVALLVVGGRADKPRASVLGAHSIEMAIPVLRGVEALPARAALERGPAIAGGQAEEKAQTPQIQQASKAENAAPTLKKAKDLKVNSTVVGPKQSLKGGLFDYGEKSGSNPDE